MEEVEAVVGRPASMIMLKQLSALDDGCLDVLARSPIAGFGHRDSAGTSRTTFVGGAKGFVRVHSPTRISFPLDGAADGPASLVFLLPGTGETLRVNGVVRRGGFDVEEVYVHCAQAVLRSGLWQAPAVAPPAPEVEDGPLAAPGVADFVAAAPFLVLSTWDSSGGSDTSPRGDQRQVARIVDGRTLVLADRRGNRRADTLHNLLSDNRISFAALVPGRNGVLHVRGRATITADPAVLEPLSLRGIPPHAALLIDVEAAELTANDAVTRSRLWNPAARGEVPDLMALASRHLAANSPKGRSALLGIAERVPARWLRALMNLAYRSGLRKEGYEVAPLEVRATAPQADPVREVRVVEVRHETPSAVTLVLEDGRQFDFRPGQFFTLVTDIDGEQVRRPYSASCAPGGTRLEVTVKQTGRFSTHVRSLRPGDRLGVRGPSGDFRVGTGHDVVLVAAGSGITPVMSVIRTLLAGPGGDRIALLYSNRTAEDVIFAAELAALGEKHPDRLSVTHVLTSRDGRLDGPRFRSWTRELALGPAARFYLCGPEPLTEALRRTLEQLGVPDDHVHAESYASSSTSASTPVGAATPQRVHVESGGRAVGTAVVEPGQTLLDAGLAAGLPMPYSCTVGSCRECAVKLLRGQVSRQTDDGRVLTCTSAPLTDVTLEV
ncbi:2Fe-2S iron-sulfur cluster-binding protein [Lentzea jiangxiensis]|uniref:2Fe-2S iron-sulfur cluster-binding protein n=1 Tax=Lentzea jiangxiensis TaxID=641025 RepID=UPI001FE2281E|nr:2Fe-2S iron-sulfur cluster-binding protein [Lentzea jiangxiensis]